MTNISRGELPFVAAGRELFLCYGTREIAEIQAALGFRRPNPFQPSVVEEEYLPDLDKNGKEKTDAEGLPVYRKQRILVGPAERQRRMLAAFDAAWLNPDPDALLICFRIGLRPWERKTSSKVSDEAFDEIIRGLGMVRAKSLHFDAITFGSYLAGTDPTEEEGSEGKAESAATASST